MKNRIKPIYLFTNISIRNISIFLFFIFQLSTSISLAQIWRFGNGAGLEFSSGGTQAISGGAIYTNEGCSVMEDANGGLLFYTDGTTVWDNTNSIIATGLNGNNSSTQSALIVKKPGEKNHFYIFTVDESAGSKGACYTVLDISKKIILKKNLPLLYPVTEKITATSNANGKDYWILFHQWNSSSFFAYPLTDKGIGSPIISTVGLMHNETGSGMNRETIGEMKFSHDGKKIALAICFRATNNFETLDFDNATGIVTNSVPIALNGFPYGICFSPDNSKLYISFMSGQSGIRQYDFATKKTSEITQNERDNSFGSIQVGFDGKIYVARTGSYLDLIEEPNKTGKECRYQKDAIYLETGSCNFGLPNYVTTTLGAPVVLLNNKSSFVPAQGANISKAGHINRNEVRAECKNLIEQPFTKIGSSLMTEISVCESNYTLNAKNPGASYFWSTSQTTQNITVDTSRVYHVAISKNDCVINDSIRISFKKDLSEFRCLPGFNPDPGFFNTNFYYTIQEVDGFELTVFNKRKVLFQTNDTSRKWDGRNRKGKLMKAGEYRWVVSYTPRCGKDRKKITKEGSVIVERNPPQ